MFGDLEIVKQDGDLVLLFRGDILTVSDKGIDEEPSVPRPIAAVMEVSRYFKLILYDPTR